MSIPTDKPSGAAAAPQTNTAGTPPKINYVSSKQGRSDNRALITDLVYKVGDQVDDNLTKPVENNTTAMDSGFDPLVNGNNKTRLWSKKSVSDGPTDKLARKQFKHNVAWLRFQQGGFDKAPSR